MTLNRRDFMYGTLAAAVSVCTPIHGFAQEKSGMGKITDRTMRTRRIPGTEEELPIVGLGTWQQFDVSPRPDTVRPLRKVLEHLFRIGGSVIDSSPMYGRAESIVGRLLENMGAREKAFLATKVWTRGRSEGVQQMKRSMDKMNVKRIDLMQVHNLVDWQTHLPVLRSWKEEGRIRYFGVTHYTVGSFDRLAAVMEQEQLDFVQLPLSIGVRGAADRLLPIARKQEIGVVVNRPFEGGSLFSDVRGRPLPDWAEEIGCSSWAQYFLKYILGHRAVTCVIPGTSDPEHMLDNAGAGIGPLPDETQRKRMLDYWKRL